MRPLLITAMLALAGCATTSAPMADVTRFHLGTPIPTDTISIITPAGTSLEAQSQGGAIAAELTRLGFRPVEGNASAYVATWKVEQTTQQGPPKPPRFSIGLGGGTFSGGRGGGVGISGGTNIPIGATRAGDTIAATLLILDIKRRSDNSIVWEGRASRASLAKDGNPIPGLARALFANFPGPSGQMVQVPAK